MGADEAHAPAELEAVDELVDVVVEASGTQPGLDLSTRLVRPHGTISILGYHQSARTIDMEAWNWKGLDVANAHVRDRAALRASTAAGLALQASGRIDIATLITHRFDLDHVDDAFRALRDKPHGYVKAMIGLD
jgi:threonine dehydrogenase-like Zn-dependent dehydrogenase